MATDISKLLGKQPNSSQQVATEAVPAHEGDIYYIHPQYTDTVPAVEVSAALGEDDPRLSIVFYE